MLVLVVHPEEAVATDDGLDADTLRGLNARISVDGQDQKQVATDWLKSKGFLK